MQSPISALTDSKAATRSAAGIVCVGKGARASKEGGLVIGEAVSADCLMHRRGYGRRSVRPLAGQRFELSVEAQSFLVA